VRCSSFTDCRTTTGNAEDGLFFFCLLSRPTIEGDSIVAGKIRPPTRNVERVSGGQGMLRKGARGREMDCMHLPALMFPSFGLEGLSASSKSTNPRRD